MGWGHGGTDSRGREIGYSISATCDHPGCTEEIHRGLEYACGGIHGEDVNSCEGYFCYQHLGYPELPDCYAEEEEALIEELIELGEFGHSHGLCLGCCRTYTEQYGTE